MAVRERGKAVEQHSSCCTSTLREHTGRVIKAQPVMVLRAISAVAVCSIALAYCYLHFKGVRTVWCILAAAELAFCVHYWCCCVPYFTNLAHRQVPPEHDARFIKQRLLEQLFRVDDLACLASWFLPVDSGPSDVMHDNLKELFAYAIWYKSLGEMEAEGLMPELDDLMDQLDRKYGKSLPPGYNPNLRFMSHLWEPLRHMYRPLVVYIVMELLTLLCHVALLATGFRLRQLDGISYYSFRAGPQRLVPAMSAPLRHCWSTASMASSMTSNSFAYTTPAASKQASRRNSNLSLAAMAVPCSAGGLNPQDADEDISKLPIVFLHGVGAGLLPYLTVVFRLAAQGQPMLLPHSKHVSMRLVSWIPTVDDMADATAAMLAAHGFSRAAVLGHSYGTMVASRLVMKYPQLVHSMCLIDPVCFAMFMPNLLRNFLYVQHNSGCWWLDLLLRFVASELHCCANFSRKFFWSSINLWDEHIPDCTLVVLGGKDILSPAAQVDRWLREHTRAHVMFEPSMRHAGMLLSMEWQAAVVSAFVDIMHRPATLPPALQQPLGSATDLTAAYPTAADPAADVAAADATVRVVTTPVAASKALPGSACKATDTAAAPDSTSAAAAEQATQPHHSAVTRLFEQSYGSSAVLSDTYLQEDCGLRQARSSPLQHGLCFRRQQQQQHQQQQQQCGAVAGVGLCHAAVDVVKATAVGSPSKVAA